MTKDMEKIVNSATSIINTEFDDELPTLEDIRSYAEDVRSALAKRNKAIVTDEEFEEIVDRLQENIMHKIGDPISLNGEDDNHLSWYFGKEREDFCWNRYKKLLLNKHWGPKVVAKLNETTNAIMDKLGDPTDHERSFQRRGLLMGDVQSGKTATYTAICNKAADAGYKVIIVLAGLMENLRVQTQQRLDAEFVGFESKYTLDRKAKKKSLKNAPVGVGLIPPRVQIPPVSCFTSEMTDFKIDALKAMGLSLKNLNSTALFVVKKNKSVLQNLKSWLMDNNADYENGIIDLPLLLIDDECDNASVNTNKAEKDPTAINNEIRDILNNFRQASYLGITATPFANIFIDSENKEDATRDLFPKDFLTVLPSPELYIGADKIFGAGNADEWDSDTPTWRKEGMYGDSLIPIYSEEQEDYFKFKHKDNIVGTIYDLPESLQDAIQYFILATAITDQRKDLTEHRSMLVNVSRYTKVQNRVADLVDEYLTSIKLDIESYSQLPLDKAMQIENIKALWRTWKTYKLESKCKITWEGILKDYIPKAIERIEVRAVNQEKSAASFSYAEYRNVGMRVIAVGGNSLSRGITLEGLCVSYFYRNTAMYDTLLQMGRWFGYRPNYDDLFKIWMSTETINWFGFITDAVRELKSELKDMERQKLTPSDFGLKVRMAPDTLLITARNKMRAGVQQYRPVNISKRLLETVRLKGDEETIANNEQVCRDFIKEISCDNNVIYKYDNYKKAHMWHCVDKKYIIDLVKGFVTHPWSLNFQPLAIAECIAKDQSTLNKWDVAILDNGRCEETINLETRDSIISVKMLERPLFKDVNIKNMLKVNDRHLRIAPGGITRIGLTKEEIDEVRELAKSNNLSINDQIYLGVKNRKPLVLIYPLLNEKAEEEGTAKKLFAIALGFPDDGVERIASYVINTVEQRNCIDENDYYEDEDDDDAND